MANTVHRCTDPDCTFVGQVTSKSCGCHKTAEQMLKERVEELEAALNAAAPTAAEIDRALYRFGSAMIYREIAGDVYQGSDCNELKASRDALVAMIKGAR